MATRRSIEVENPRRSRVLRVGLGVPFMLAVAVLMAAPPAAIAVYAHFAADLPAPPALDDPPPPVATRFSAHDGRLLAEMGLERREAVPLARMPDLLIAAFLAAEDQRFFEHDGVDLRAVARALYANVLAGRTTQGASTLTQQLCKDRVGRARAYARKAREAILARRTEATLSKLDILSLYLNRIYLGQGAYGVQAASRTYFGKNVEDLTLAEAATLAGLPPQPGRLNPVLDPEGSLRRRRYVLARMVAGGFVDAPTAAAAEAEVVAIEPAGIDPFDDRTPAYTEHARQWVQRRFGYDRVHREGLDVALAVRADWQHAAHAALVDGLERLGERQGFVGAEAHLEGPARAAAQARAEQVYEGLQALAPSRVYAGIVTAVARDHATVQVGSLTGLLPLATGAGWARPFDLRAKNNGAAPLTDLRTALTVGDVVRVRAPRPPSPPEPSRRGRPRKPPPPVEPASVAALTGPRFALAQAPPVEGALVAIAPDSGQVAAMVGGYDFDRSEYNRAFQGCRQPGSVFKPLVYSLALDRDQTLATAIADTPVTVYDHGAGFLWKPRNFGGKYRGEVLMHEALAWSLNLPAVRTLMHVSAGAAAKWATHLGITTPMPAELSLVLGSACVHPWDMVQVYATFARRGQRPLARFVTRVTDNRGRVLADHTHPADAWAPPLSATDSLLRAAYEPAPRALSADTAYLIQAGLKAVVEQGTASAARALGHPAAGKTGTTDAYDAWFVGFTDRLVAGVWIGSDRNMRRLGAEETGGQVALPVWLSFMQATHEGRPPVDFLEPTPEGVTWVAVDPESGLRAAPGGRALRLPFKRGTEPDRVADVPVGGVGGGDRDLLEGRF